jgi:hypothetical protein
VKPGLELDALVAREIMGWRIDPGFVGCGIRPGTVTLADFPRYSRDIAAAWEVVERLRSQGIGFRLEWSEGMEKPAAQFQRGLYAEHEGETAAHAICLAALHACGKS